VQAHGTSSLHKVFVQFASPLWRSRRVESGAFATADISQKRELRYHKNCSSDITDGQTHLSILIFEDAQPGDFVCQIVGVSFSVIVGNADKYQKAAINVSCDLAVHRDLGTLHSLHNGAHERSLQLFTSGFKPDAGIGLHFQTLTG
jgi:hypothetical protein